MVKARSFSRLLSTILILAIRHGIVQARRAVGRREEGGAVHNVVSTRRVLDDDSDEWGEDEDEDEDIEEDSKACDAALSGGGCDAEDAPTTVPLATRLSGDALDDEVLAGPVAMSVRERGLLTTEASSTAILREYQAWHSAEGTKHFPGETLGYVTPWHGKGYDFARTFRSKLTYVSPVWYQIRSVGQSDMSPGAGNPSFYLSGGHDFDEAWLSDVRNGVAGSAKAGDGADGGVTKIVPRVVLELQGSSRLSQADLREMADLVVTEAVQKGYDGFVLDVPLSDGIEEFVSGIKSASTRRGKELTLIQSVRPGVSLSARLLDRLVPNIHRFSLMTYDYRPSTADMQTELGGGGGVPNSPLSWVRDCVEAFAPGGVGSKLRSMTLIGLPFYGYDNGRAITSNDFVSLLESDEQQRRESEHGGGESPSATFHWHPVWREHVIISHQAGQEEHGGREQQQHVATFPTLAFIQERVDLARDLGVGVALWELGQGMPYWFDLL